MTLEPESCVTCQSPAGTVVDCNFVFSGVYNNIIIVLAIAVRLVLTATLREPVPCVNPRFTPCITTAPP